MKLALAGVSHHRAPLELRERVAIDLDRPRRARTRARVRGRAGARGGCPLDLQPHRALPRIRRRGASRRAGRPARCSRWPARTRTPSPRSPTGSRTSRRRSICSAWLPASTRWCQERARSSGRFATRSRRARRARCSTGRSGWRCTRAGARASRRPSARARPRCRRPRPRWRNRSSRGWTAAESSSSEPAGRASSPPATSARAARPSRPS